MKCPKCGYNSFEFLDQCKKCGNDLVFFKESKGLRSVLVPAGERWEESAVAGHTPAAQPDLNTQPDAEAFSWEEPAGSDNPSSLGEQGEAAEFSFSEAAPGAGADLDDLLESSATLERTTIAGGGDGAKAPARSFAGGFDNTPGEFELEDLFGAEQGKKGEDSGQQPAKPSQEGLDGDFDFLFSEEEKK
jgi:hypothetical protein